MEPSTRARIQNAKIHIMVVHTMEAGADSFLAQSFDSCSILPSESSVTGRSGNYIIWAIYIILYYIVVINNEAVGTQYWEN